MKKMIVRADDLGYSEGVNYGVAKAVRDGFIRTVGIMPNMPALEHGLALLEGIPVCYGQHTNICVGQPLTDPSRIPSLTQADGSFRPSRDYRAAAKEGAELAAVDEAVLEIEAQYRRFVEMIGREPSYIELHAVFSNNLYQALEIVAERHGLNALPFPVGKPLLFKGIRLYPVLECGRPDYDPFESLKRAALADYGPDGCAMMVCHPGYLDAFILRTSSLTTARVMEVEMACSKAARLWLKENDVEIITYDEL